MTEWERNTGIEPFVSEINTMEEWGISHGCMKEQIETLMYGGLGMETRMHGREGRGANDDVEIEMET